MRADVRDDIIGLDSFVAAKFKLEKYIQMIKDSGNYCFLDQFKRLFENGAYIARQLEESNLIKTATLNNNYKYIYLTDTAMKYLTLKDDPRDFSEVEKSSISVAKVNKYPSEKVLMSSALKFDFTVRKIDITKQHLLEVLKKGFYSLHDIREYEKDKNRLQSDLKEIKAKYDKENELNNRVIQLLTETEIFHMDKSLKSIENEKIRTDENIKKLENELENIGLLGKKKKDEITDRLIELKRVKAILSIMIVTRKKHSELETKINNIKQEYSTVKNKLDQLIREENQEAEKTKEIDKIFEQLKNKVINLYDKSKIISLIQRDRLELCILDTGNTKTAYGYLKIVNELKQFGYKFEEITIIITSYSKKRTKSLIDEFEETQKEREKAFEKMQKYENKAGGSSDNRKNWRYDPPKYYLNAEKVYYNTPKVKIIHTDITWYMEDYKKNISSSESYIKEKDKEAIKNLKHKLK